MCRAPYEPEDARKIRIHSIVSAIVPPTPVRRTSDDMDHIDPTSEDEESSADEMDDLDERAQYFLEQITDVTLGGDRPAADVHTLIKRTCEWLSRQPEDSVGFRVHQ